MISKFAAHVRVQPTSDAERSAPPVKLREGAVLLVDMFTSRNNGGCGVFVWCLMLFGCFASPACVREAERKCQARGSAMVTMPWSLICRARCERCFESRGTILRHYGVTACSNTTSGGPSTGYDLLCLRHQCYNIGVCSSGNVFETAQLSPELMSRH